MLVLNLFCLRHQVSLTRRLADNRPTWRVMPVRNPLLKLLNNYTHPRIHILYYKLNSVTTASTNGPLCPLCNTVLPTDIYLINAHIDKCTANPAVPNSSVPNSSVGPNRRGNGTSSSGKKNGTVDDAQFYPNEQFVERGKIIETTSRPRGDESSTVYLVGIPQDFSEAYIMDRVRKSSSRLGET